MSTITDDSMVSVSADITAAELEGEMVLLDVETGHYYGLNGVGARILNLVDGEVTVEQIVTGLLNEYSVDENHLRQDIVAFLQEMQDHELIRVSNEHDA